MELIQCIVVSPFVLTLYIHSVYVHVFFNMQLAKDKRSNATCRFWNFTADGEHFRCTKNINQFTMYLTLYTTSPLLLCITKMLAMTLLNQHCSPTAPVSFVQAPTRIPPCTCNAGGYGVWDSRNCRILSETAEEVKCGCDHLTHFAILLVSGSLQGPG